MSQLAAPTIRQSVVALALACALSGLSAYAATERPQPAQEQTQAAVAAYLKEETLAAFTPSISREKGYRVSYARIGSAILDTQGVEDYENLTVNGGTGNLAVPAKQAAVLGEVTVSYAG